MKSLLLLGLLMSNSIFAQNVVQGNELVVTRHQVHYLGEELDREARSDRYDEKTRLQLLRVSEIFRSDDDVETAGLAGGATNPVKLFLTRLSRGVMRGSTWLSTTINRPLLNATGYLTGVIEREKKNKELVAFYRFFFNHEAEFDEALVTARSKEEMAQLLVDVANEIILRKTEIIIGDFLEKSKGKGFFGLSQLTPSFINGHPEYQELRALFGDLTQSDLDTLIRTQDIHQIVSFDELLKHQSRKLEKFSAMLAPVVGSNLVLGVLSVSLGHVTGMAVVGAHMAAMVSANACLKESTQRKIALDPELGAFCNYVIKRAVYEEEKARNQGYLKGKKARQDINRFFGRNRNTKPAAEQVGGVDRTRLDQLNQRPQ